MAVSLLIVSVQFLGIFPFESVNKQREGKIECNKKMRGRIAFACIITNYKVRNEKKAY